MRIFPTGAGGGGQAWVPILPARTGCQVLAEPAGRLSCVEGNRPSGLVKGLCFFSPGGQQADSSDSASQLWSPGFQETQAEGSWSKRG